MGFPGGSDGKDSACNEGDLTGKIPWRQEELPTQVSLPGKPHGQRILEDYSPWSLKESDMTKQLTLHFVSECSDLGPSVVS